MNYIELYLIIRAQQEQMIAQDAKLINKLLKEVEEIQNYVKISINNKILLIIKSQEIASKISKLRKASLEELDRYSKLVSQLTNLNYENMKHMNVTENTNHNQKLYIGKNQLNLYN